MNYSKLPILLLALAACGDNLEPAPVTIELAQSAEATAVVAGTYALTITAPPFSDDVVSWTLSTGGVVFIGVHGLEQHDVVTAVRVRGAAADEPVVRIVDQVEDEALDLPAESSGAIVARGEITHVLVDPLFLGCDCELVWVRVEAPSGPVDLFNIVTSIERTPAL